MIFSFLGYPGFDRNWFKFWRFYRTKNLPGKQAFRANSLFFMRWFEVLGEDFS